MHKKQRDDNRNNKIGDATAACFDFETSRSTVFGLQYDNGSTKDITESTVATSTRRVAALYYNTWTRDFALRITPSGSSTGDFKLHGVDFDLYIPQEEAE